MRREGRKRKRKRKKKIKRKRKEEKGEDSSFFFLPGGDAKRCAICVYVYSSSSWGIENK